MDDRQQLFDTDPASLERRVASVLRDGARLVGRFTLWYTTRPAVHGAVVEPERESATTR